MMNIIDCCIKGLEYIKVNYRNVVAHKDGVKLQLRKREIFYYNLKLLWILIYIIDLSN